MEYTLREAAEYLGYSSLLQHLLKLVETLFDGGVGA
jgi:hypothetical protein